ncbi:hypothetical protein SISNIDRAFT_416127 [Sistotremastrum niveocremeum HHB9708]|uniref:Transcription factor n=1 Tax=Sistotremastrum niveocremeum HHB9708 TaxID=1314777 RepID=A0A164QSN7_9AGAM|nr:hypothetical protein SISNIDRAFT_416127 [Sistotremastrum niveocremeum HHB9708]
MPVPPTEAMPPTSDFVKKLYKMLEDPSFSHVVSWGPSGDCFIVKDMNDFTKSILPRMFKHSNFASFVRQLNKYDFHKVKNPEGTTGGDHAWTFRHPDFQADRRDALENIKRKVPSQRKSQANQAVAPPPQHASAHNPAPLVQAAPQVDQQMQDRVQEMSQRIRDLEANYASVLNEIVNFQRVMAQQDRIMKSLIQLCLNSENERDTPPNIQTNGYNSGPGPASAPPQAHFMHHSGGSSRYPSGSFTEEDISRVAAMNRRTQSASLDFNQSQPARQAKDNLLLLAEQSANSAPVTDTRSADARRMALQTLEDELNRRRSGSAEGSADSNNSPQSFPSINGGDFNGNVRQAQTQNGASNGELQIFTVGQLRPRQDDNDQWNMNGVNGGDRAEDEETVPANPGSRQTNALSISELSNGFSNAIAGSSTQDDEGESSSLSSGDPQSSGSSTRLRVRRSTFVPSWTVAPRVLLVEDDAVSRRLSSKFLQVFGCTIDVAVDGEGAVNKMNLEKYDLVLMDIFMPKLDGVTATTMIRQFDHMTPIISMTSNSNPDDVMLYFSRGMNDILPKPFTKENLLGMLEKHLMHLKVIQQMAKVPRSIGIPPLSDTGFEQAIQVTAAQHQQQHLGIVLGDPTMRLNGEDDGDGGDGVINPLAGMGLSDEQYQMILQNLVNNGGVGVDGAMIDSGGLGLGLGLGGLMESHKRGLDDDSDDREGKRSRFEVLE